MADHWYNNYSKIKLFGRILYQAGVFDDEDENTDPDEIFDYFNKPSVYDEAYQLWESLGSPQPNDKEWDQFADNIQVQVVEGNEDT